VLRPRGRPWYEVETAIASYGQGVSVTTVQLATAFSSIANGGRLLEPLLVRRVVDARGQVVREGAPHVRRESVPPNIARLVTEMLTAVTEPGGTAVEAAVPGFRVAGKTGTAQKADPATGKYSTDRFTASFTGIVPAERPRLVIAVVLDEPMIGHYGGDLAGPVFRRVAEASLRYLGVAPTGAAGKAERALASEAAGKPAPQKADPVVARFDAPYVPSPMVLGPNEIRTPDATGLGAREALKLMVQSGLTVAVEGTGRLVRQVPSPGAAAAKGSTVRLVFESSS
jgi:cell division protein FtsI (penicillin-binding protein 3)